jgi:branched-chain amino acid transport system substrate-binding protein
LGMKTHARRQVLHAVAGSLIIGAAPRIVQAKPNALRVGVMLPASGTYAPLGAAILQGMRLALQESGNQWGGRSVEFVTVDDESNPSKAPEQANRLIARDKVDLLVGSVHSGVALGMAKVARESGHLMLIPNAGANALTGSACAPNVFRTSFSNWQTIYPLGKVMADKGIKTAAFLTWKYTAGQEYAEAFAQGFEAHGGKVLTSLTLPFPQLEFGPLLAQIAAARPQAVSCFFSGSGAAKFLLDYARSGLKDKIPLYVTGHTTEGILHALKGEAEGITSVLHYADGLPNAKDKAFRQAWKKVSKLPVDVFAVQGYDTGLVLAQALKATQGDPAAKVMQKALEGIRINSPRGDWTMSKAHNPIQDIYLRQVVGQQNLYKGIASKALEDPGTNCRLS